MLHHLGRCVRLVERVWDQSQRNILGTKPWPLTAIVWPVPTHRYTDVIAGEECVLPRPRSSQLDLGGPVPDHLQQSSTKDPIDCRLEALARRDDSDPRGAALRRFGVEHRRRDIDSLRTPSSGKAGVSNATSSWAGPAAAHLPTISPTLTPAIGPGLLFHASSPIPPGHADWIACPHHITAMPPPDDIAGRSS